MPDENDLLTVIKRLNRKISVLARRDYVRSVPPDQIAVVKLAHTDPATVNPDMKNGDIWFSPDGKLYLYKV